MDTPPLKPWYLVLLITQVVFAITAIATAIFIFKIGVAAIGVIILLVAYCKH